LNPSFARKRRKKVTLVAKSNVLKSSVLWREVVNQVAESYPDIENDYLHVDNAAMQLILNPKQFDVCFGLYEPIHGSAPSIAGQNITNPINAILCIALMLKYTFNNENQAALIENAVRKTLELGYRTIDLYNDKDDPHKLLGTEEMGDIIAKILTKQIR
jgi:3-isopropylmalate dehydrogenase